MCYNFLEGFILQLIPTKLYNIGQFDGDTHDTSGEMIKYLRLFRKPDILTRCCFNVGRPSPTVDQH